MKDIYKVKGNYYITSDEVGKKGDWVVSLIDDESFEKPFKLEESHFNCGFDLEEDFKKIILTTHELLIKDGVQSIDKPFLIWLINNPNCKKIEVNFEIYPCLSDGSEIVFSQASNFGGSEDRRNNINTYINQEITDNKNFIKSFDKKRYKIVIPKEQNKQGIDIKEFEQKANEIIANVEKKETIYFQPPGINPKYCEAGIIHESDPEHIWYLNEPCKTLKSEVKIIPKENVYYDKKSRELTIVNLETK